MNWQDVKWPLKVFCWECLEDHAEKCGHDAETFYTIDANGEHLSPKEVAELTNTLHAELSQLRETQRKLAFLVDTNYNPTIDNCSEITVAEYLADPLVAAAIKEAGNE